MIRTIIEENIVQYQFAPEPGGAYGFNLYALLHGRDALLIDTAFQEQAAAVLADHRQRGYSLCRVLISHFHPDHISGLSALPGVEVWGSAQYRLTLDEFPREVREKVPPVRGLTGSSSLEFGAFSLAFQPAPGHSPCSLYTIIDGRHVHVADNLMAANDGTPLLPWADFDHVGQHIRSLEMLASLCPEVLLLGHGQSIVGEEAIAEEIGNRLAYLQAVLEGNGDVSVEEATAGCSSRFLCEHWHIRRDP